MQNKVERLICWAYSDIGTGVVAVAVAAVMVALGGSLLWSIL